MIVDNKWKAKRMSFDINAKEEFKIGVPPSLGRLGFLWQLEVVLYPISQRIIITGHLTWLKKEIFAEIGTFINVECKIAIGHWDLA